MFFWLKKRDYDELDQKFERFHSALNKSFLNVKTDITHLVTKIEKLKNSHDIKNTEILKLHQRIDRLENLFNDRSIIKDFDGGVFGQVFRHKQPDVRLNQGVVVIRTEERGDRWARNLTPMERTILNILLNTDMKLSYEDLSVMLGRDKSTIRGQMNNMKQKNEGLLNENIEKTGKKRFYIEEKLKSEILKERLFLTKKLENEG